jgi:hypothetical protein
LNSFDTISSHLETTFSALSTALARSRSDGDFPLALAYLAILVGPGIRTAKARVVLGFDGLEKRIWGSRDDARPPDIGDRRKFDDGNLDTEVEESEGSEEGGEAPDDSESEEEEETDDEDDVSTDDSEADAGVSRHEFIDPKPHVSREEEQKFLQNADRLLSRVLANADANGKGMSSEMGEHGILPRK